MLIGNPDIENIVIELPDDAEKKYPDLKDTKLKFKNNENEIMELNLVIGLLNERFQLINDGPLNKGNTQTYVYLHKES